MRLRSVVGIAAIAALGVASFSWLRPTNFRGYDEWLIFWMLSRGLVSFPHADRPLGLVWHLPAWWLAPDRLWGFLLVHAAWLTLAGALTFLLVRRRLPGAVAFLAGAFTIVWMPSELTRIASVQMIQYSGAAAGVLGAAWLLAEAWQRKRPELLALAAILAAVTALSLEATLPLLAAAPLLLLALGRRDDRRQRLLWIAGALILVAAAGARLLVPLLAGRGPSYQTGILGATRSPRGTLRQIGEQFKHHLWPLFERPGEGLAHPAVAVAVLVFVAGFVLVWRCRARDAEAGASRARLLGMALAGLSAAALGYLPFALARAIRGPERTEFLAAPGIAVALAALATLAVSWLPLRARAACACALGAWVVAVGSSRTLEQQRRWHEAGAYAGQRHMLQQLAVLAPAVEPHSLVILLQSGRAWTFEFSVTKAIEYLYDGSARGSAAGTVPALHATRFEADAIVSEPDPALQSGWRQPVERYRYDEALVFAEDAGGGLALLEAWPEEDLGPLPPGAAYSPRARVRPGTAPSRRFAILAPEP